MHRLDLGPQALPYKAGISWVRRHDCGQGGYVEIDGIEIIGMYSGLMCRAGVVSGTQAR